MFLQRQGELPHEYDDCEVYSNNYEVPIDSQYSTTATNGSLKVMSYDMPTSSTNANSSFRQMPNMALTAPRQQEPFYEMPENVAKNAGGIRDRATAVAAVASEYIAPLNTERKTQAIVDAVADYEVPFDASS